MQNITFGSDIHIIPYSEMKKLYDSHNVAEAKLNSDPVFGDICSTKSLSTCIGGIIKYEKKQCHFIIITNHIIGSRF